MPATTRGINRDSPDGDTAPARRGVANQGGPRGSRQRPARQRQRRRERTPEEEEEEEDEEEEITTNTPASVKFKPSDYKLDGATAMRKFAQADFPKLSGPTNFMDWQTEFKRAMIISNYWGFFSGGYNGGRGTPWYEAGYQQAIVFLQESCMKEKAMEIQHETDPIIALDKLEKSSKAIGNSHYFSLQKQFQGTTQASCGTAKDFKAAMLNINRQLVAMNPKYRKPTWEMNSWFINNLTDAYENKVSALSSNPKVIAIEGGMSFDDLCLEIIEEEQRLTEKNGTTNTTVAFAATKTSPTNLIAAMDQATLALKIKELDKETRQLRASVKCPRCGKTGHTDTVGVGGCFRNPANAEYKNKFWEERKSRERRAGKRPNDEDRARPDSKKRRVESKDYNQVEEMGIAINKSSFGPPGWDE